MGKLTIYQWPFSVAMLNYRRIFLPIFDMIESHHWPRCQDQKRNYHGWPFLFRVCRHDCWSILPRMQVFAVYWRFDIRSQAGNELQSWILECSQIAKSWLFWFSVQDEIPLSRAIRSYRICSIIHILVLKIPFHMERMHQASLRVDSCMSWFVLHAFLGDCA